MDINNTVNNFYFQNNTDKKNQGYMPVIYRIYNQKDKASLEEVLKNNPHIQIFDQISTQLDDLIKLKHPKRKFNQDELDSLKKEHIGNISYAEYGVWVYYPWSDRLVHLLDEEEFIEVRTNRNIYKITREEREIMSRQKIGVVGLSVGQSISLTMAMERSFGEIRLADFDLLELTNLNRIRSGVHNLGVSKVIIVAREIKEIDPFLKVTCFTDGLTEENMDRFFSEGGNLDIAIDECDGLDIKILLRHKAKALGIPVVMDMSDRGTLDVERFDLEPERPILHGLIDHLDHDKAKGFKTNEDKLPYMLAMVGVDTLSPRMKASLIEVGQSITTWPQLASAVALGGALGADVCRRIILDQYHESGRYWVDLEELIGNKNKREDSAYQITEYKTEELTLTDMTEAIKNIHPASGASVPINKELCEQLVKSAILAPSAGNNQPWKWFSNHGKLFLFHDEKHSALWGDFDNITSNIAFGAAIENLKIEAGKQNLEVSYQIFPNPENKKLIASFEFKEQKTSAYFPNLAKGIEMRLTNRKAGNKHKINPEIVSSLKQVAESDGLARFDIIQDEQTIRRIADIVGEVERIRFLYPQGHHDFYTKEMRWTDEEVRTTRDGLDIKSLELSENNKTGLRVASNPDVIKLLNKWGGGAAFEKLSRDAIQSSSAVGLISMPEYNEKSFIKGGESVQRLWLDANLKGLSFHPISAPLFLFARLNQGNGQEMTPKMIEELSRLQEKLNQVFPSLTRMQGIFMFRLSFADEASVRSLRRPLEETLFFS